MTNTLRLIILIAAFAAIHLDAGSQVQTWPIERGIRKDVALAGRLLVRVQPWLSRYEHQQVLESVGLKIHHAILPYEQSVTGKKDQGSANLNDASHDIDLILRLEEPLLRSYVVEYTGLVPPEKMVSIVRPLCSEIEICEPVYMAHLAAVPDDPQVTEQKMLETIKAFQAWDVEEGSASVVIGISDSGMLQDHEDLKDAIAINEGEIPNNGIDDDENGYIDDYNGYNFTTPDDDTPPGDTYNSVEGHGTGVAGICGATVNNGIGVAGVANKCKIFPLKTMPLNIPGIVYGYESIMYCALNGIQVVNCSWGGFSKSCINESVVEYAIARNVAVVAAAGNHGTSTPFYPGAYNGVLNVGVTNPADDIVSMTGFGPTVDVMAPGQETLTTSNDGTYGGFCCTSGSSPIVAAVVALLRSQKPELTGLEACAVVRATAESGVYNDVPSNVDARLLPKGRVDVLATVNAPDNIRSLEFVATKSRTTSSDSRWASGDTIRVGIEMRNVLSSFLFSEFEIFDVISNSEPALTVLGRRTIGVGKSVAQGDTVLLPDVTVIVGRDTDTTEYISARLHTGVGTAEEDTIDVKVAIIPAPPYRTLANNVLELSVGDRARIGNTDLDKGQGAGFNFKEWCGQLFEGGLMISSGKKVVDGVRGSRGRNDHFSPIKRFTRPNPLVSVVRDSDAPDTMEIGLEVTQRVRIGGADSAYFITDISIKNVSDSIINDVSAGWFYDWDLGLNPVRNTTWLDSDQGPFHATQVAASTDVGEPIVMCGSVSLHNSASPISAGVNNTITYRGFPPELKSSLLSSGVSSQYSDTNDVAVVNGMHFRGSLPPGQSREFRHFIVIDVDPERLREIATAIRNDYVQGISDQAESVGGLGLPRPNPVSTFLQVDILPGGKSKSLGVFDAKGRKVLSMNETDLADWASTISLDVRSLGSGMYQIRYVWTPENGDEVKAVNRPFVIVR